MSCLSLASLFDFGVYLWKKEAAAVLIKMTLFIDRVGVYGCSVGDQNSNLPLILFYF